MTTGSDLAKEFSRVSGAVDPSQTSTTKWRPVEALLAEALGLDVEDVYAATVSKAGNLSVRAEQSGRADAAVMAVMWTGSSAGDFDRTVKAAHAHCGRRDLVLLVVREPPSNGWAVRLFMPARGAAPSALTAAWPKATVVSL